MIRVLIADDHAIVRQGIRQILNLASDIEIVDEARNGWEVIEKVRRDGIDVLLLDMTMPGPNGVELIKRIKSDAPTLPILVLSMHAESQFAGRAINAGTSGYLTKDSEPEELIEAIRRVGAGRYFIDPALAAKLIFGPPARADKPHAQLSDREYQVFILIAQGRTINEIAESLCVSAKTISTHK
ncbi:MAG: response regulator transcription factor, partial [Nevskia sp.]|nr:response regulator transcription factor [Nevskia sp.]